MSKKIDIGSLYRQAFDNYAPTPPDGVWEGINNELPQGPASGGGLTALVKPALMTLTAAAIVTVSVLLLTDREDRSELVMNKEVATDTELMKPTPPEPEVSQEEVPVFSREEEQSIVEEETTELITAGAEKEIPETEPKKASPKDEAPETAGVATAESPENKGNKKKQAAEEQQLEEPEPESAWERHRNIGSLSDRKKSPKVSYSREQTICRGESVTIGASNGSAYEWADGSTTDSIRVSPQYSQVYDLTILRTDNRKVEASIRVNVKECATLYIPNAFTPNGDGQNDEYRVEGLNIEQYRIVIQSDQGTLLFESNDMNETWDGKHHGEYLPQGIYLYHIDYVDTYGNVGEKNGRIMLIR